MKYIKESEWELRFPGKPWPWRDDANHNGIADRFEDTNHNGIPDGLERPHGTHDHNWNGIPDGLEVPMFGKGPMPKPHKCHPGCGCKPWDKNHNGIPDFLERKPNKPKFETENEKRLRILEAQRRDEAFREHQIQRLQDYRNALAVRDAAEYGRAVALREAEKDYRIKQSKFVEDQLNEVNALNRRMNGQYKKLVDEVLDITARLSKPETLFPESFITAVNVSEDYISLIYSDGRRVNVRDSVIGAAVAKHIAGLQADVATLSLRNGELTGQLAGIAESQVELQQKLAEANVIIADLEARLTRLEA